MGYYINYSGHFTTRGMTDEDIDRADGLLGDAFYDGSQDGDFNAEMHIDGFCKYRDNCITAFFEFISPFVTNGEIFCSGEDGSEWKYEYNYGTHKWLSLNADTRFPHDDENVYVFDETERRLMAGLLLSADIVGMTELDRRALKTLRQKIVRLVER